jgi:hypothetical protein
MGLQELEVIDCAMRRERYTSFSHARGAEACRCHQGGGSHLQSDFNAHPQNLLTSPAKIPAISAARPRVQHKIRKIAAQPRSPQRCRGTDLFIARDLIAGP